MHVKKQYLKESFSGKIPQIMKNGIQKVSCLAEHAEDPETYFSPVGYCPTLHQSNHKIVYKAG